jgi:hypothetical protein
MNHSITLQRTLVRKIAALAMARLNRKIAMTQV